MTKVEKFQKKLEDLHQAVKEAHETKAEMERENELLEQRKDELKSQLKHLSIKTFEAIPKRIDSLNDSIKKKIAQAEKLLDVMTNEGFEIDDE